MAGAGTAIITYPLDISRTLVGIDTSQKNSTKMYNGIFHCIKKIYVNKGIRGVYMGLNCSILGLFVYKGLYFGLYDSGKYLIMNKELQESYLARYIYAQFVVIVSETISYPTDTIKRRLMV